MLSTRDRFTACINQASTPTVAAGLCAAVHQAELRELREELMKLLSPYLLSEALDDVSGLMDSYAQAA